MVTDREIPIEKIYEKENPQEIAKSLWGFLFVWIANKPSTSDNSTLCASTAYVQSNLANYLPINGGTMTTSYAMKRDVDDDRLVLIGSTRPENGAYLRLSGKDESEFNGRFELWAIDGTNRISLIGSPNGSLRWNEKEVERVNSSGSNYIRFESGYQICFGSGYKESGVNPVSITYQAAFIQDGRPVVGSSLAGGFAGSENWTKTGFVINFSSSSAAYYTWICVGLWK